MADNTTFISDHSFPLKKFNLLDYDAIGFDLDLTLAKYNVSEVFNSAYTAIASHLVETFGYPQKILNDVDLYADFCCKGLVLDVGRGNILKLDRGGHVIRCCHGTRTMAEEEICSIYGDERTFEYFKQLSTYLIATDKYALVDNYFDSVAVVVFGRLVDVLDERRLEPVQEYSIWGDIRCALNATYFYKHFADKSSQFFCDIRENPDRFVRSCSDELKRWLRSLKQDHQKTVFLMTSSYVDFATCVLKVILGPDWKEYFDVCLMHARKPSFFNTQRSFLHLDENNEVKGEVKLLKNNGIYSQGNVRDLSAYLRKSCGKENPKVVYFGDSLKSDAFYAKTVAKWDIVFVSEELGAECQARLHGGRADVASTTAQNGDKRVITESYHDDGQPHVKCSRRSLPERTLTTPELGVVLSSQWGSIFHDSSSSMPKCSLGMNTFYGDVMARHSDLVIPHMDYILDFLKDTNVSHSLSPRSQLHPLFYPHPPLSLGEL